MLGDDGQDVELRELVAQTLENNGVLPKIRAELRASVFLALEDQDGATKSQFVNKPLKEFLSTKEGSLIISLVRELLEYFELDNTLAVFDPETKHGSDYHFREREQLLKDLKINNLNGRKGPLLAQILQLSHIHNDVKDTIASSSQQNNLETTKSKTIIKEKQSVEKSIIIPSFAQDDIGKSKMHRNGDAFENSENDKMSGKLEPIKSSGGGSSLLGNLPPLSGGAVVHAVQKKEDEDLQRLQKDMLDLGLDSPENNYDEDFHSSPSNSPHDEPSKTTHSEIEEEVASTVDDPSSHQSDMEGGMLDGLSQKSSHDNFFKDI